METKDAFTITQFCERHGISRSKYYELAKKGIGPRIFRVGTKPLISKEAAADWRVDMEKKEAA